MPQFVVGIVFESNRRDRRPFRVFLCNSFFGDSIEFDFLECEQALRSRRSLAAAASVARLQLQAQSALQDPNPTKTSASACARCKMQKQAQALVVEAQSACTRAPPLGHTCPGPNFAIKIPNSSSAPRGITPGYVQTRSFEVTSLFLSSVHLTEREST